MHQLTHKTLQLVVPQGRRPQAVGHQSEEGFLDLKRTQTPFGIAVPKTRGNKRLFPTCSVVSKMTSLELVGMAS